MLVVLAHCPPEMFAEINAAKHTDPGIPGQKKVPNLSVPRVGPQDHVKIQVNLSLIQSNCSATKASIPIISNFWRSLSTP